MATSEPTGSASPERLEQLQRRFRAWVDRLPRPVRSFVLIIRTTYEEWRDDRTIRLGAGLAYYGLFSLASVFTLSLWMVQLLGSRSDVEQYLTTALDDALGEAAPEAASAISAALHDSVGNQLGLVGLASLLITGSLFFIALEDALNQIWGVPVKHGFRWTIRRRLTSFLVLLAAAATLIASLAVQAISSIAERFFPGAFGSAAFASALASGLSTLVLAGAIVLLFAYLPSADVKRGAALVAGVATSVLLIVGTNVIGWYLRRFGATSVTGAAASIIAILIWIFYEAQILLAGAQLAKVLSRRFATGSVAASG